MEFVAAEFSQEEGGDEHLHPPADPPDHGCDMGARSQHLRDPGQAEVMTNCGSLALQVPWCRPGSARQPALEPDRLQERPRQQPHRPQEPRDRDTRAGDGAEPRPPCGIESRLRQRYLGRTGGRHTDHHIGLRRQHRQRNNRRHQKSHEHQQPERMGDGWAADASVYDPHRPCENDRDDQLGGPDLDQQAAHFSSSRMRRRFSISPCDSLLSSTSRVIIGTSEPWVSRLASDSSWALA